MIGRGWIARLRRARGWIVVASLFVVTSVLANALAWRHAHSFLQFRDSGERTAKPEQLTRAAKLRLLLVGVTVPRPELERTPSEIGLEFEELTFAGDDDVTLSAWRVPAERSIGTVVLFHGYAQAKDSLLEAAVEFHALRYTCYLIDFRGSGGSSEDYTTLGIREADDVRAVLEGIERADGPLILYGVSMGAAAILRAVGHDHLEADALILDAPFDRMLTTVRNRFEQMEVPAFPSFPAAELLVYWGGRQLEFDGFAHEPVVYAAGVITPTLILSGADDPYAQRDEVGAVFAALAGPKRIREVRGVAHEQIAVVRTAEFREAIESFLAELELRH